MSNIAGKAYAMNTISPIPKCKAWKNRLTFWAAQNRVIKFLIRLIKGNKPKGLVVLSMIHYARWLIVSPSQFPNLGHDQPKERLKYVYEVFFSNFNGSWDQYVDSFHMAIPSGLDRLWANNFKYPGSVPLQPFHDYIEFNQPWTNHYYNAYPMATSNDVKSAQKLKKYLLKLMEETKNADPETFLKQFNQLLRDCQHDISLMEPTPIVSLAADAVAKREAKRS